MTQIVIAATDGHDVAWEIRAALKDGWLVHSITVNSDTDYWIAILYKEGKK